VGLEAAPRPLQGARETPHLLRAIQAAVVGTAAPPLDMLAVLAADGGDASVDALMPVFVGRDAEARLEKLAVHAAKTPAMAAMLQAVTVRRVKKEAASSAVAFVSEVLQLDEPLKAVKFTAYLASLESETGGVPLYQGSLTVDSRWDDWWRVELVRVDREMSMSMKRTSFGAGGPDEDQLGVGTSAIADLPQWVASGQEAPGDVEPRRPGERVAAGEEAPAARGVAVRRKLKGDDAR
jgi:hypothetical protein